MYKQVEINEEPLMTVQTMPNFEDVLDETLIHEITPQESISISPIKRSKTNNLMI